MGRLSALPLTLLAVAALALALSACGGGSDAKLLPGTTASQITSNLDEVRELVAAGECIGAEDAAASVSSQVDALGGVDKKLKAALREGATRLNEVVAGCQEAEAEEVSTEEFEEPETAEKPPKPEKKPKPEKPENPGHGKPEKETPPETTEPPQEETEGEVPAEEEDGGTPSGGVGPGVPAGGE